MRKRPQRRPARELSHFTDEIAGVLLHDWCETPKRIAARHFHATGFEYENAGSNFSGYEKRLIPTVTMNLTKTAEPINFRRKSFGNILSSRSISGMAFLTSSI